ncbi:response regulator [Zunongwangia endophytica]|uniref:Response regulator n=1 Tax=Zunongwangia endophytica TaxID=1808945 RepID=A0ABV8HBS5_9FLAO|nr:response regulator [Zunongwangia endophytica]MDN3593662.1 response regulator [Zunongwangia endophytica]
MLEVILVDDDDIVLMMQKKMVLRCGIASKPVAFKSATETLNYLNHPQNINNPEKRYLILLDINMPKMNGWEFLDELKNHPLKDNFNVIMVTSSIDRKDRLKAKSYQRVIDYIEKPVTIKHCNTLKKLEPISEFF